jgi:hypothetical protein
VKMKYSLCFFRAPLESGEPPWWSHCSPVTKRNAGKEFLMAFGKELEDCGLPGEEESRMLFEHSQKAGHQREKSAMPSHQGPFAFEPSGREGLVD